MSDFNRRRFLEGSAGVAAAATVGTGSALFAPFAQAQNLTFKPEKGAKLRVLRWSRFVQGVSLGQHCGTSLLQDLAAGQALRALVEKLKK